MKKEPYVPEREDGKPREISKPLVDPRTGCWIWQGSLVSGYGKLSWHGKIEWAHRVYYEIANGPPPPGRQVHHECENRACVNPAHLTLLTPRDHGRLAPRAKLSLKQVRMIRERAARGEVRLELAEEYGVTRQAIGNIVHGRSWHEAIVCPNCGHGFDPYA